MANELVVKNGLIVSGSATIMDNLTVQGTLTAENYVLSSSVIYVTESYASGSHNFGDTFDDYHLFTGSIYITGALQIPKSSENPVGTTAGQIYYNTGDTNIYRYNGSTWLAAAGTS